MNRKTPYYGLGTLVGLTNFAIANNTVSIIFTGPIARDPSEKLNLDNKKAASILDIGACIVQGIMPYGAQVLLLSNYAQGRINLQLVSMPVTYGFYWQVQYFISYLKYERTALLCLNQRKK